MERGRLIGRILTSGSRCGLSMQNKPRRSWSSCAYPHPICHTFCDAAQVQSDSLPDWPMTLRDHTLDKW